MNTLGMLLLADFEVVKNMSSRFHGKQAHLHTSDLLTLVGLILIVILAACFLKRLTRKNADRPKYHKPQGLFRELCQAHEIDRSGRSVLELIAEAQEVPPSQLFVDPELLQPEKLGSDLAGYEAQCRAIAELLFARPDEPVGALGAAEAAAAAEAIIAAADDSQPALEAAEPTEQAETPTA